MYWLFLSTRLLTLCLSYSLVIAIPSLLVNSYFFNSVAVELLVDEFVQQTVSQGALLLQIATLNIIHVSYILFLSKHHYISIINSYKEYRRLRS